MEQAKTSSSWFFSALALLFIGLKLTGYIHWSWWWVLAPIWMPTAVVLAVLLVVLIGYVVTKK